MQLLFILTIVAGSSAAMLIPMSSRLSRTLAPGPTVKGPGDLYAEAFGVLIVLFGLIAIAVLSSVLGWIGSYAISWTPGQWLACMPIVLAVPMIGLFRRYGRD